jgi:heme exporter protein A
VELACTGGQKLSDSALLKGTGLGAVRGERILFSGLNFTLEPGELVVLRGANGSGKTTLLRQLAGLSVPQAGRVERRATHHWLGHSNGLKAHETPRRHLIHWAGVWGSAVAIGDVLDKLGLRRPGDVPCRLLSAGQTRRTALGRLLLEDRSVWLLDEPFNALDSAGQVWLAGLMQEHCAQGGAIVTALHGAAPITPGREFRL